MKLPSLQTVHVLVVGDLMLDRYWIGDARRVSQEAPVPVVDVTHTDDRPGGAANVALNVASLGARCTLVGLVGDDEAGRKLRSALTAAGVVCDFVEVPRWPTILKLRIVSQNQQLLRTDFEEPAPGDFREAIRERVRSHLAEATIRCAYYAIGRYDWDEFESLLGGIEIDGWSEPDRVAYVQAKESKEMLTSDPAAALRARAFAESFLARFEDLSSPAPRPVRITAVQLSSGSVGSMGKWAKWYPPTSSKAANTTVRLGSNPSSRHRRSVSSMTATPLASSSAPG